jgi:hypothetical protein
MGFLEGLIGLVIFLVVLIVFVSISGSLLPTIISDSGSTVGMLISSMVIILIVGAFYLFFRTTGLMGGNEHANLQQRY